MILVKFSVGYGRAGKLEGLFITTPEDLAKVCKTTIYFGEVLGKHSEVEMDFEMGDFKLLSTNEFYIRTLQRKFDTNSHTLMGYNPVEYLRDQEEEY
jgi:hypothetical protein